MKLCRVCHHEARIAECSNVRPWILAYQYSLIGECPWCPNTLCWTIWREPDEEELLLAGELRETANSLSDLRNTEAA